MPDFFLANTLVREHQRISLRLTKKPMEICVVKHQDEGSRRGMILSLV